MPDPFSDADFDSLPGPYIRRLQQIAVALFLQETATLGLTPVQYGALLTVRHHPGVDQRTLAGLMGLDTSTTAGVVDRLDARGLLRRNASPQDRRVRLLSLTDAGEALLMEATPLVNKAQSRILAPLAPHEQATFMRMLHQLVDGNNELSRAPTGKPLSDAEA
jgi:DNA-binding MarR family transcriptional regulator